MRRPRIDARPDGSTLDPGARCSHGHHHADQAHQGDGADDAAQRRPPDARRPRGPREDRARGRAPHGARGVDGRARPRSAAASSAARTRPACPSSSRSAGAGCSSPPSPSTAGRRRSWPPTWPRPRRPACGCRPAATRTSRTSASSRRRTARSCSTSTTSTRRCPGPWEWDVKRMAASIEIAGRDRGEKRAQRRKAVAAAVRRYREAMRAFAGMTNLQVWYARLDITAMAGELERGLERKARATFEASLRKAEQKSSLRALTKLTESRRRRAALPQRAAAAGPARGPGPQEAGGSTPGTGRSSSGSSGATRASRTTAATSSTATASSTSPARWSGSAASARAPG